MIPLDGEDPHFGPYRLLARLGEGGMGVVYLAEDTRLARQVALKRLRQDDPTRSRLSDAEASARFEEEIRTASRLEHPGIVKVYEVGAIDGQSYFTMELVLGRPLDEVIAEERLGPIASARLVLELARALEHAHGRGVVHRDLKPSNVLVDDEYNPRLVDFGLAKRILDPVGLTKTGFVIGTPQFMAPEQLEPDFGPIGPHTDVYGLGGVLHACLTGEPPNAGATEVEVFFHLVNGPAPSPRRSDRRIPSRLSAICRRALGRRLDHRHASARDLADELEDFLRAAAAGESAARSARAWWVAAGVAALLVVAGGAVRLARREKADGGREASVARWRGELEAGLSAKDARRVAPAAAALSALDALDDGDRARADALVEARRRSESSRHLDRARAALASSDLRKAEALARLARAIDPDAAAPAGALLEEIAGAGRRWQVDGETSSESDLANDPSRHLYQGWLYRTDEANRHGLFTEPGRCASWVDLFLTGRAGTDETQEELPAPIRFRLREDGRPEWSRGEPR